MDTTLINIDTLKSQVAAHLRPEAGDSSSSGKAIVFRTNDVTRGSLNSLRLNLNTGVDIFTCKAYKTNGVALSGANLNHSAGVTINNELDSKQDNMADGTNLSFGINSNINTLNLNSSLINMTSIQSTLKVNAAGTGKVDFIVSGSTCGFLSSTELDLSIDVNIPANKVD